MRHVRTVTPAGSKIDIKDTGLEIKGLRYLTIDLVNQNGLDILKGAQISFNVAWALMCALQTFLPEDGAECTTKIISEA